MIDRRTSDHGEVTIGMLGSRVRFEEKLLLAALKARDVGFEQIDARSVAAAMARQGRRIPAWSEQVRRYENKASRAGWVERLRDWLLEDGG